MYMIERRNQPVGANAFPLMYNMGSNPMTLGEACQEPFVSAELQNAMLELAELLELNG